VVSFQEVSLQKLFIHFCFVHMNPMSSSSKRPWLNYLKIPVQVYKLQMLTYNFLKFPTGFISLSSKYFCKYAISIYWTRQHVSKQYKTKRKIAKNSYSADQEIPCCFRTKDFNTVHRSPPVNFILSQFNAVHFHSTFPYNILLNLFHVSVTHLWHSSDRPPTQ